MGTRGPLRPAEEGVRVPGEEEPEDKATPAKRKKRDPSPDKRVFVTEPLPKKVKPALTSEGDEDPWFHVHPDGNHLLKDCHQVNGLTVRMQRQGGGTGPGACFSFARPLLPELPHRSPRQ